MFSKLAINLSVNNKLNFKFYNTLSTSFLDHIPEAPQLLGVATPRVNTNRHPPVIILSNRPFSQLTFVFKTFQFTIFSGLQVRCLFKSMLWDDGTCNSVFLRYAVNHIII